MNKPENRFCVYTHTRPDKNEIFYIGIGVIARPYDKHSRNKHWKNIVAKNNGEFIVDIIGENLSWDFCCAVEIGLIKSYGRVDNKTGILCNMTNGGDGTIGVVVKPETREKLRITSSNISEETREKMRKAMTGRIFSPESLERMKGRVVSLETRTKISIANSGKKASDETKRKLRESHLGYRPSDESLRKRLLTKVKFIVQQRDVTTGALLNEYVNMSDACRKIGMSTSLLEAAIDIPTRTAKGFRWVRSYDLSNLPDLSKSFELCRRK